MRLRDVSRLISLVVAVLLILAFYFNVPFLRQWEKILTNWAVIVAGFALGLGAINLGMRHVERIRRRPEERVFSGVCLIFLVGMTAIGVFGSTGHPLYKFWFGAVIDACQSSVSAFLIFYIATAAFRAFHARNVDAAFMLVATGLVILGQAPIGGWISRYLPAASTWLIDTINLAGQRGLLIASGIGALAASFRILLGIDRGPFSKSEG